MFLKKKLDLARKHLKRSCLKIKNLQALLQKLKDKYQLSTNAIDEIDSHFTPFEAELLKNQFKAKLVNAKGFRFSDAIKRFSICLYYHSPKAYEYVRKCLHLPHPHTLSKWISSVNCKPGLQHQVLDQLKRMSTKEPLLCECSLTFDGMSIRSDVVWDRKSESFLGFIDYGGGCQESGSKFASEALVVMAVGLKKNWKAPIGFMFVNGIDVNVLMNFIIQCVEALFEVGKNLFVTKSIEH